ncbi:Rieske 2Fe-2S domain-containing protein [Bordetella bronchiseptica]|uniref:Rieske 2Fe-2S domain-containing protein n=1 Tax=Bordetella bronchiseptica TaxID=518 RepID=UPI003F7495BF
MLSQQDNELLTRTGPGTAMGQVMRRFWMPALLAEQLPAPDCPPVKVRLLGEDLLAFRDTAGRVGLVEPVCPHRGANLYYGRNEEHGLRCVYHGWKFDVEGNCLEVPTAPCTSGYKDRIKIKAYPTREWGDIIWAYMGPLDSMPELPMMEFGLVPPSHRHVSKKWQDCNWAQCLEGAIDTAHFSFLHMIIEQDAEKARELMQHAAIGAQSVQNDRIRWVKEDTMPTFAIHPFEAGLTIGGARQADGEDVYWRIAQFLMPNHALVPSAFPGENYHGQTWVPSSDGNCWIYTYTWNPDRPLTEAERALCRRGHTVHAEVDADYRPLRGPHNDYLLDREKQRQASFTGIDGVSEQDAAVQDSQGPIVDRTRENLGATDIGIVKFRQAILAEARALAEQGIPPRAAGSPAAYAVRSGGWVCHRDLPLDQVMVQRFGHQSGYVGNLYGLDKPCREQA